MKRPVTALIGRLRHCQNIDPFSIVNFVVFKIINDIFYEARKNGFACILFKKPMHADVNDIITCLIRCQKIGSKFQCSVFQVSQIETLKLLQAVHGMLLSKGGKQEFPHHPSSWQKLAVLLVPASVSIQWKLEKPLESVFCCHVCCGSLAVSM